MISFFLFFHRVIRKSYLVFLFENSGNNSCMFGVEILGYLIILEIISKFL